MELQEEIQNALVSLTGMEVLFAGEATDEPTEELCAIVNVNGTPKGVIRVGLSTAAASRVSGAILGEDMGDVTDDEEMRNDVIGEIVNVLAGRFKHVHGVDAQLMIPVVQTGHPPLDEFPHDCFAGLFRIGDDTVRITTGWKEGGPR